MSNVYSLLRQYQWGLRQVRTKRTKRTANQRILYIFFTIQFRLVYAAEPVNGNGFPSSSILRAEQVGHLISESAYVFIIFSFNSILLLIILLCSLCVAVCTHYLVVSNRAFVCNVWHFQHRKERRREKRPPDTQNETNWLLCAYSLTRSQPAAHSILWWFDRRSGDYSRHICFDVHAFVCANRSNENEIYIEYVSANTSVFKINYEKVISYVSAAAAHANRIAYASFIFLSFVAFVVDGGLKGTLRFFLCRFPFEFHFIFGIFGVRARRLPHLSNVIAFMIGFIRIGLTEYMSDAWMCAN